MNKGNRGTKVAKQWFKEHSWEMIKVEPEFRIITNTFKGMIIKFTGEGKGLPDFLGTPPSSSIMVACEVKAAPKDWVRFPCSWVKPYQRKYIEEASFTTFIGIMWEDESFEIYDYKPRGSYKKGEGLGSS